MTQELVQSVHSEIQSLLSKVDGMLDELNELTIEITEIPAPPFNEEKRAKFVANYFKRLGYTTKIDEEGNVLAFVSSIPDEPVILSAHLDTVFQNQEINVIRDGDKLYAPGVGDDSRGLANLLLIAKILQGTRFLDNILFVASVGEEGLGDLRGVKHLFSTEGHKIQAFITIDGSSTERIVDQGMGSLRYRLYIRGPGGHSYGSFGTVNPLYALGEFMLEFRNIKGEKNHKSTFSLGVVGGGTSINAIPEEVWVDIDLRSETSSSLQRMWDMCRAAAMKAIRNENRNANGTLTFEFDSIGDRPPGRLSDDQFRQIISNVHDILELELVFSPSSTDANIPMSKNIPAISVAGVENSNGAHTQDEWIDASSSSLIPVKRNLLLISSVSDYYSHQ